MYENLAGKSFHLVTFGCQMNKHDSERITGLLMSHGAYPVDTIEESDIAVFVTCCVREAADVRLRGQVASMKNIPLREGSILSKRIVAIGGCIGQRDGDELLKDLPHVDAVFGTHNIGALPSLLDAAIDQGFAQVQILDKSDDFPTSLPTKREHVWSAWVPISIGCNNFCSYCIVPYVRGREKSRPFDEIVSEVSQLVSDGVREITLLGQNVNSYGADFNGKPCFAALLKAVAATGIERIRFATSHPKDLTDEVIDLFGSLDNLMPAIHLPVQSGSDVILSKMNRRYTSNDYLTLVRKLRAVRPDIALSTDIIVGFPGETEEDFMATYNLVREVGYTQVFTFLYSPRAGTPAAKITPTDTKEIIQERFDRLIELVQSGAHDANQAYLNTVQPVLIEGTSKRDETMLVGRSPHNLTVHAPLESGVAVDDCIGTIIDVSIDESKTWYLSGTVCH